MSSVFVTPGDSVPVQVLPPCAVTPVMAPEKSPATLVPPLSLVTTLMMVNVAALSSLVTVQVFSWSATTVTLPVWAPSQTMEASYPSGAGSFSSTV